MKPQKWFTLLTILTVFPSLPAAAVRAGIDGSLMLVLFASEKYI
jgi:hypothetical protein